MPLRYPGLVLGYHGCDQTVADRVISGLEHVKPSRNSYDWLGHGMYFWENNSRRALDWAVSAHNNPRSDRARISTPAVIGVILDLGNCLNLTDTRFLSLLPSAYQDLEQIIRDGNGTMPTNRPLQGSHDNLLRDLDCAVIETLHDLRKKGKQQDFDSARGVFTEGVALFPGAEIRQGNHIQICIRNPDCVIGYFRPRDR